MDICQKVILKYNSTKINIDVDLAKAGHRVTKEVHTSNRTNRGTFHNGTEGGRERKIQMWVTRGSYRTA
jgi:hypothetical protein